MSQPSLKIVTQESLEQEIVAKNGEQKRVHSVIKNQPFNLTLHLDNATKKLNLHSITLTAFLVYDTLDQKAVDFVRKAPMHYDCTIKKNENGIADHMQVEVKLIVLSSQHEDMFFRVKFSGEYNGGNYGAVTEAIRVVSKPAQLKRNKTRKRKRTANDKIVEALARIEAQQKSHQEFLGTLYQTITAPQSPSSLSAPSSPSAPEGIVEEPAQKRQKLSHNPSSEEDFQFHLRGLLKAFQSLPQDKRANVAQQSISDIPKEDLNSLLNAFAAQPDLTKMMMPTEFQCLETFPQTEISTGENFYQDFLMPNILESLEGDYY
eukprot:TRINITY_DN446_c0_g1_i4.p1 TRINITY_DN446_c0_g1~~TRINITY_DN446_c0_g1_i4.p1  ORF type:complete len:319 (-),score=50.21 TRINITY_DN446_c0_g1_i4:260-1216(-)